jgi:tetratricopeptide (TPR) repeat protein
MRKKEYSSAKANLEFILNYYPNHPRALALLSEVCDVRATCDMDAWFDKAIQRNPNAPKTYLIYAVHLQRRHHLPEAIDNYKKAISLDPMEPYAHYDLGLAYFDAKQFVLANREAQIAASLGVALPGLRNKLERSGQWQVISSEELRRMIQTNETSSPPPPR